MVKHEWANSTRGLLWRIRRWLGLEVRTTRKERRRMKMGGAMLTNREIYDIQQATKQDSCATSGRRFGMPTPEDPYCLSLPTISFSDLQFAQAIYNRACEDCAEAVREISVTCITATPVDDWPYYTTVWAKDACRALKHKEEPC